jgi:Tfp pilus assembly protein PilN
MAVPPTVPTSFVPRPSSFGSGPRRQADLGGAFAFLGYGIFVVTCLAALGIFLYGFYLDGRIEAKNEELIAIQKEIDEASVQKLVALHHRLTLGRQLLDGHVVLSGFFDLLEEITLRSVYVSGIDLSVANGHNTTLTLSGVARNFNALAAQSKVVGDETLVNDAIFSNIKLNAGGSVGFTLSATLDDSLIKFALDTVTPATVPSAGSLPGAATTP